MPSDNIIDMMLSTAATVPLATAMCRGLQFNQTHPQSQPTLSINQSFITPKASTKL